MLRCRTFGLKGNDQRLGRILFRRHRGGSGGAMVGELVAARIGPNAIQGGIVDAYQTKSRGCRHF